MNQVLHDCPDCPWTGLGDRCVDLCPNCGCLHVVNRVNPDGVAVNDRRPEKGKERREFHVAPEPGVYFERLCMLAR